MIRCARLVLLVFFIVCARGCAPPPVREPTGGGVPFGGDCSRERCAEGLTCRYEGSPGALASRCRLEVGRCRDGLDCAPSSQRCLRLGERLGVCRDAGI